MRGVRGVIAGALALVALQAVVATRQGPGRVAGLVGNLADVVAAFVDPRRPLLSDRTAEPAPTPQAKPATLRYPDPTRPPTTATA
jgi:hypothetical protein